MFYCQLIKRNLATDLKGHAVHISSLPLSWRRWYHFAASAVPLPSFFRSHLRPTRTPFKVPGPHLKVINLTTSLPRPLESLPRCWKRKRKEDRQTPAFPGPSIDKDKDGVGPIISADFCHCPKKGPGRRPQTRI